MPPSSSGWCWLLSIHRSLVRQLSSCKSKETMNPNSPDGKARDASHEVQNKAQQHQQQPKQVKKQVRRRFHTSRPYQEKLLNMAEARREIVAALRLHRETMRKASDQQCTTPQEKVSSSPSPTILQGSHLAKRYRTSTSTTSTSLDHFNSTCFSSFHPSPLSWPCNTISSDGMCGRFNSILPRPPLGLNLNFNDFEDFETTFHNGNNSSPFPPFLPPLSSSASSSSYSCSSCATTSVAEFPTVPIGLTSVCEATSEPRTGSFHPVMDDKEMEEIRSIGEQHDIEWNDRMNSVHSAWWCEFLKNIEAGSQGQEKATCNAEGGGFELIDGAIGIPPWLTDQQMLGEGCLQGATLPCLDIGEINGTDGEWLL